MSNAVEFKAFRKACLIGLKAYLRTLLVKDMAKQVNNGIRKEWRFVNAGQILIEMITLKEVACNSTETLYC